MRKFALAGVVVVLLISLPAAAKSKQTISLLTGGTMAGVEVKPGEYTLEVANGQVILCQGKKEVARAAYQAKPTNQKFPRTTFVYSGSNITEIRLANRAEKLVLAGGEPASSGASPSEADFARRVGGQQ